MENKENNVIPISSSTPYKKDLIDSDLFKQVASIVDGIDGALEIDDDLIEVTSVNIGVLLTDLVEYFEALMRSKCLKDITEGNYRNKKQHAKIRCQSNKKK